jgi:hypothetical protein
MKRKWTRNFLPKRKFIILLNKEKKDKKRRKFIYRSFTRKIHRLFYSSEFIKINFTTILAQKKHKKLNYLNLYTQKQKKKKNLAISTSFLSL